MTVGASSWVVQGAATTPQTLQTIGAFVHKNRRGCVFIDEIDKACPRDPSQSSWALSVFGELLALLDGDERLLQHGWQPEDLERFQRRFIIIGAGTWQHLYSKDREIQDYVDEVEGDLRLPPEITLRFNARPILIAPPAKQDYLTVLIRIHRDLDVPIPNTPQMDVLIEEAIESGRGMRWVEDYLTDLCLRRPGLIVRKERLSVNFSEAENLALSAETRRELTGLYYLELRSLPDKLLRFRNQLLQNKSKLVKTRLRGDLYGSDGLVLRLESLVALGDHATVVTLSERADIEEKFQTMVPSVIQQLWNLNEDHLTILTRVGMNSDCLEVYLLLRSIHRLFLRVTLSS